MGNTFKKDIYSIDDISIHTEKKDKNYIIKLNNFNLDDYDIIIQNDTITLNSKNIVNIKDINSLRNYNFSKSVIKKCKINNILVNSNKYKDICIDIFNIINNKDKIISACNLKIISSDKLDKKNNLYFYSRNIDCYIRYTCSNIYIAEIYRLCIIYDIKLSLHIKLLTAEYIKIKI